MSLNLNISITPKDGAPTDWALHVLKNLVDALESPVVKDYQIKVSGENPIIIGWKGKKEE